MTFSGRVSAGVEREPLQTPLWLRSIDLARRLGGYKLRTGPRIHRWLASAVARPIDTELFVGVRLRMDLRQIVERNTWWSGRRYERPTPDLIVAWAREAERFFDIGANYGFYSYLVVSATRAHAYAFEPIPSLIDRMEQVKRDNDLERLHPIPFGVSDSSGELRLHLVEAATAYSSFGALPQFATDPGVPVPVVGFDEWCTREGISPSAAGAWVAKIDVEGLEDRVLRGMEAALAARAFRGLVVELNEYTLNACGSSSDEIVDYLRRFGYVREQHQTPSLNGFFVPAGRT
jgi:FkbM family methyltransferase